MVTIREAKENDAKALIVLRGKLFKETTFLLLEPDEYNPTEESEANFIRIFSRADNSSIFLALNSDSKIVGFMGVAGGITNRTKHRATVFLGVLSEYWGQGIGKQLFDQLFIWLPQSCLSRVELT
ncbi:MAG: GNAT family N-acetyltransferase, partial [Gammaproteobacteria bacterium]|nr:GNAT family N-acetyltransferase [Gammaproteobacteria bacterium]MBT6551360.1 GNAT family N-acetyltransferase [Gammaproteobacteria bacterium]